MSCQFNANFGNGIDGNGHVITKERTLNGSYNAIKVSRGIEVDLTQSDTESLSVKADENLQEIITTTIENDVLIISTNENIGQATSKTVIVYFNDITSIKATSGSVVYSINPIHVSNLELDTTSGSDLKLVIDAESVSCHSTSGSDMDLRGKTNHFTAEATSGSSIDAESLITQNAKVKASSGADIRVNTSKELTAKISSGGNIRYTGNPEFVNIDDSASGSIKEQ